MPINRLFPSPWHTGTINHHQYFAHLEVAQFGNLWKISSKAFNAGQLQIVIINLSRKVLI